jgi:hypothetical protein
MFYGEVWQMEEGKEKSHKVEIRRPGKSGKAEIRGPKSEVWKN